MSVLQFPVNCQCLVVDIKRLLILAHAGMQSADVIEHDCFVQTIAGELSDRKYLTAKSECFLVLSKIAADRTHIIQNACVTRAVAEFLGKQVRLLKELECLASITHVSMRHSNIVNGTKASCAIINRFPERQGFSEEVERFFLVSQLQLNTANRFERIGFGADAQTPALCAGRFW